MYIAFRNILILFMLLALFSCGWDMADSDPWRIDTVSITAAPGSLQAGQSSIITATVNNAEGKAVRDRTVTFTLRTNNSGGKLSVLNVETKGDGKAVTLYTAGNDSPEDDVEDIIQVSLSNSASAAVIVTRSAKSLATIALSASPTSVDAGQISIITATVAGGANAGVNEAVTLTIPINASGAGFVNAGGASVSTLTITTGNSGTATAIYQAGAGASGTSVRDTVEGVVLSSGAFNAVTITRNAGATGYIVTVTANPSTIVVPALGLHTGVSLITANVKTNNGILIPNATVLFTVSPVVVPGGTVTSPATTDGNGNAVATYTSAHTAATTDVVTASTTIGGFTYTGAATITVP